MKNLGNRVAILEGKHPQTDPLDDLLKKLSIDQLEAAISLANKAMRWQETGEDAELTANEQALFPLLEATAERQVKNQRVH